MSNSNTSDIDIKVESDSEADSDEDNIKSENDDGEEDTDQNQAPEAPKNQRRWKCEHSECGCSFNSDRQLKLHLREHNFQTELSVHGKAYTLTRQSLDDRWQCPIPECTSTFKTIDSVRGHIQKAHANTMRQRQLQQQQHSSQMTRKNLYFIDVDDFYFNGTHCSYHNNIGVFICHECRLVPECLLTHLQQKHGYDEKSIDSSDLPESAVSASADPNGNQHTSNSHLSAAISRPYWQHHQNIVQGWLCTTADCGYCCCSTKYKSDHKKKMHKGEQLSTIPALVLRLLYAKTYASGFLITRLETTTNRISPDSSTSQYNGECDDVDDGDELVLSDYSDEDDIH